MQESEQVWLAVVNLHAGSGKTASLWKAAEKLMDRMDIRHDNKYTDFKYHAAEIAYEAAASGFRKFIAVGGDGTIHEVLEGIMKYVGESSQSRRLVRISDFYLAVIPIGSGNDWIRIHNIGYRAGDTLKLIRENSFVSQDIVKVTAITDAAGRAGTEGSEKVSYMVNVGGVGFDARVCERVNAQKIMGKRSKFLYIKALFHLFFNYKPLPLAVFCDGEKVFDGNCFSVALGTGKYCGGGLRQTPYALFDDGLVDLTVIPDYSLPRILLELPRLFNGTLPKVKGIISGRGRSVHIIPRSSRMELIEVDGEIIGNTPVRFEVLPEQINVLHAF